MYASYTAIASVSVSFNQVVWFPSHLDVNADNLRDPF